MKLTPLINFCKSLDHVSDGFIADLEKHAIPVDLPKNTQLYPNGLAEGNAIFVVSGLLRKLAAVDGKHITLSIYRENEMIGYSETSCYLDSEILESVSDAAIILLPKAFVEQLYLDYPEIERIARKILAIKYQKIVEESKLSRLPSADHRYNLFNNSDHKFRLPAKILASYLVMREETLSRLKSRYKKLNLKDKKDRLMVL
ncbi:Crp/Fnr family transcriptional regulator [Pedobacter sandarakinus]|uniref:Crp/Fnr family transcriptional regulator n=1 Tax=Pedobacter sandarakinus TaxID=353156 RepID=UPI0022454B5F|nr:hypothetical protein [Pedobacter sandarakinus]MCX2574896.1 hypothetical protein [Pedobacter sandarakinus]